MSRKRPTFGLPSPPGLLAHEPQGTSACLTPFSRSPFCLCVTLLFAGLCPWPPGPRPWRKLNSVTQEVGAWPRQSGSGLHSNAAVQPDKVLPSKDTSQPGEECRLGHRRLLWSGVPAASCCPASPILTRLGTAGQAATFLGQPKSTGTILSQGFRVMCNL